MLRATFSFQDHFNRRLSLPPRCFARLHPHLPQGPIPLRRGKHTGGLMFVIKLHFPWGGGWVGADSIHSQLFYFRSHCLGPVVPMKKQGEREGKAG